MLRKSPFSWDDILDASKSISRVPLGRCKVEGEADYGKVWWCAPTTVEPRSLVLSDLGAVFQSHFPIG